MYELDYMLNGRRGREHHEELIRQAHQDQLVRDIKASHQEEKPVQPVQSVLTTVINLIARIG